MASCAFCRRKIFFRWQEAGRPPFLRWRLCTQRRIGKCCRRNFRARCRAACHRSSPRKLPALRRSRPCRRSRLVPRVVGSRAHLVVESSDDLVSGVRHQEDRDRHGFFGDAGLVGTAVGSAGDASANHQEPYCARARPRPGAAHRRAEGDGPFADGSSRGC